MKNENIIEIYFQQRYLKRWHSWEINIFINHIRFVHLNEKELSLEEVRDLYYLTLKRFNIKDERYNKKMENPK